MAKLPPPPAGAKPGDFVWGDHHRQVRRLLDESGNLSWASVDTTGSSLTDIITRNHNDLQTLQGGTSGEYYHLTSAQRTALTTSVDADGQHTHTHNNLASIQGGTSAEYYHLTSAQHTSTVSLIGKTWIGAATTDVTAASHTHAVTERYLLCDTTSNAITVNLVAAATAGDGYRLDVKVVDATNAVTIDGNGSETIDGATTKVLSTLYDGVSLVCDGSNWYILASI